MSFLTRTPLLPARQPFIQSLRRSPLASPHTSRAFHPTPQSRALSESDHDTDPAARKKAIDEHKSDQLEKQKEGKGEWKRELSSNSESAVKADSEEGGPEELQRRTEGRGGGGK